MFRSFLILGTAFLISLAAAFGLGQKEHEVAYAEPAIYVVPTSGSQFDTFVLTASGFSPGAILSETYTDPNGTEYTFYEGNGKEAMIQADDYGSWHVSVQPATDFQGAYPGTWHITFCLVNTNDCWSGDIQISL